MPDPKDSLIYLNDILNSYDNEEEDYREIIKNLLEYANDEDWSGMGSMKFYLENILE